MHNLAFRSSATGTAKIPFKKLLVEIAGARLATEISVQFAFNSSDARLKVKGSSRESGIRFLPHPRSSKTNKVALRMARVFADCLPFHKRFP
jgi:hypothetical protein